MAADMIGLDSPREHRHPWKALVALALLALGAPAAALDPQLFPVPAKLEPNVEFWTQVYTAYTSHQVLVHDERHLNVIYGYLDFTALDASSKSAGRKSAEKREEIRQAKSHYRALLQDLAAGRTSKSHPQEQERIRRMFESVPGGRSTSSQREASAIYSSAISRIRTQTCLQDQFAEGIERSGVYMRAIEEVFSKRDLPLALTRLPFVESLFQWHARSSAAAGGIWQFVPSTARLYRLKMDLELDERYDPLRATDAAARHLEDNYRSLRTWPLAITAYNHGAGGMRRAVRKLGTRDMGEIATRYRSRNFGFASRNFYSEFIAAARIYENREHYFPGTEPRPALASEEFSPGHYVPIRDLAQGAGLELSVLKAINPALTRAVWDGHVYLPQSYPLRVPAGRGAAFEAAYAALPNSRKSSHQVGYYYRVRKGDTLSRIAEKFGTSTSSLQRANKLRSANRIRIGQRLLIPPGRGGTRSVAPVVAQSTSGVHVVRRGETLSGIADAYRTSTNRLRTINGLRNADRIYVGQRLRVSSRSASGATPGGATASSTVAATGTGRTHVVRSGETLHSIARRYGTTVRAIQNANRIRNTIIHPAQVLVIP